MSTASEQAAAFLAGNTQDAARVAEVRGETGDYARLRELIARDDLTDDELDEFGTLAEKRRSGTLEGSPRREVYKRKPVGGERDSGGSHEQKPKTASEIAARQLRGGA